MNRTRISRLAMVALAGGVAAATTHVVVKGDTLWDITGHYLGNPFLWPSVWKRNTQIKDAHWIYPGDTVTVTEGEAPAGGSDRGSSNASNDASDNSRPAPASNDPLAGFRPGMAVAARQQVIADTNPNIVDMVVPPETSYLNDQLVLMAPLLVPNTATAKSAFQGRVIWDDDVGRQEVMLGAQLTTDVGTNKGLKVGDRVLIVETGDEVATVTVSELPGTLEQARGIAVVIEAKPAKSILRTEKVFGRITRTAVVRPWANPRQTLVTQFRKSPDTRPDRVLANTRMGRVQMPGTYVMVDRGEASGVLAGDIYEFMDGSLDRGIQAMRGYGMVVSITSSTATVIILGANPKPILPGDKAWRIRVASHG